MVETVLGKYIILFLSLLEFFLTNSQDARANLFAGISRSANPSSAEKAELEQYYIAYVRDSSDLWWGYYCEYWLQIPGIVQWLLYQYLRGRKSGGSSSGGKLSSNFHMSSFSLRFKGHLQRRPRPMSPWPGTTIPSVMSDFTTTGYEMSDMVPAGYAFSPAMRQNILMETSGGVRESPLPYSSLQESFLPNSCLFAWPEWLRLSNFYDTESQFWS